MGAPKHLTDPARFFLEPIQARHRQYEALRAYFVEHRPSADAARAFGYTPTLFRVLCHHFRHDPERVFFVKPPRGPRLHGFEHAKARQIYRRFLDTHAKVDVSTDGVRVRLPRRAHNPLLLHSGMLATSIAVSWWGGAQLKVEFP